ncbi:hypothetical protein B7R22_16915 [Subtercola boreus]|uniref:IrrE N-terminal-like domain-containing protein n=1 Tax=Subtercola boreus TaxID=120213 RepID=A0A3E0VQ51_9MICO|nr:ImmA/IrrE family metallo-endopeptidase [Subtercola boreus]RFA12112.1 hypothetical protein B7R22_16915 [Subtercola boreus]
MSNGPTYDPFEHADRLGVNVLFGRIRTANGLWVAAERTIILKRGLKTWHERQVLTHELGHVVLGHTTTEHRFERQANRWAARKLITPGNLAEVVKMSPDPGVWALELGVTDDMLALWFHDRRIA